MSEADENNGSEKNETETAEQQKVEEKKKGKKKYVHNCTKCGQCCKDRPGVTVTIADIENWTKKGMITTSR